MNTLPHDRKAFAASEVSDHEHEEEHQMQGGKEQIPEHITRRRQRSPIEQKSRLSVLEQEMKSRFDDIEPPVTMNNDRRFEFLQERIKRGEKFDAKVAEEHDKMLNMAKDMIQRQDNMSQSHATMAAEVQRISTNLDVLMADFRSNASHEDLPQERQYPPHRQSSRASAPPPIPPKPELLKDTSFKASDIGYFNPSRTSRNRAD